ncbi:MAG: HAMP domain-containing sensor histidine kinase [Methylococcales bacterium]|nr:HAMP domain-containing sensor histidine kinase [Methylococcales bacterium]
MKGLDSEFIYPCPISKDYSLPIALAWLLLKIFLLYRLILATSFVLLFYSDTGPAILGSHDRDLFVYSAIGYALMTLGSAVLVKWPLVAYNTQAQWLIFSDIVLITLIMHACGGVVSGVGILLSMSIAAGGVLIGGRCALVFAAIASVALLSEQVYAHLTHSFVQTAYTYAGMLGGAFFAIALLSVVLAKRSEQSHRLAVAQQHTIRRLEQMNQMIVEHLQSGLMVFEPDGDLVQINQAAMRLTKITYPPQKLQQLEVALHEAWQNWRIQPGLNCMLVTLASQEEIQLRFSELKTTEGHYQLMILEDNALYNQRLQQSKLVSLGQMSASIAHEIRNPLGAISHAAQLLQESSAIDSESEKLCRIIQNHSQRLNRIVEDILQLSRKSRATAQVKLELNAFVAEFCQNYLLENALTDTQLSVQSCPQSVYIRFDSGHLQQILDNLCTNALRYGYPERGPIVFYIHTQDQQPYLDVIDQGHGIALATQKHLFEPFFTTCNQGTGLGLYLSRTLAELNQARLSYLLSDTSQTTFRLAFSDGNSYRIEI